MFTRVVFVSALLLTLAGCNRNPLEVTVSRCFGVAVVGDLGTLVKFQGEGRTTDDVTYTASIMDISSSCTEAGDVRAQTTFTIGVQSGPAFMDRDVNVEYFVAVVKDNSQIVSKRVYDVTLRFDEFGNAQSKEVISQYIPTIEQARRYNYELLVGFQMEAEDAVFNMVR
tara:strand:+ start:340 stop:846 length:507 start_codon:yes stop_codon:yes gene_type:complete